MISKIWSKMSYILSGIAIGLINGFFGGGGGMVCVPVLENVLKLNSKQAHATALVVIFPLCLCSGIVYFFKGNLQTNLFVFVLIGFVVGGIVGAYLLKKLNNIVVKMIFAVVVFVAGLKLVLWFGLLFLGFWAEFWEEWEWVVERCLFLF